MRFRLKCVACGETFCVNGHAEDDVNATVLDDKDPDWDDACEHVRAGGAYEIVDSWYDDYDDYGEYR